MSAQSSNRSPESTPVTPPGPRIVLLVPDVNAAPAPLDFPSPLTRIPATRTRGMEVLQRVLARRAGLLSALNGPNRWQNRLWLATFSLIGVSCLMLVIGMRQSGKEQKTRAESDPLLAEEFESDLEGSEGQTTVRHVAAYHAPGAGDESTGPSVIQPIGYEAPRSGPPRGAWLEGTILPDETEE